MVFHSLSTPSANDTANEFRLMIDVSRFGDYKAHEIGVRLVDGQDMIEVTGEENWRPSPGGSLRRSFAQRHVLPLDADKNKLKALMAKDGKLTITAPRTVPVPGKRYDSLNHWNALNQVLGRAPQIMDMKKRPIVQVIGTVGARKSSLDLQRPPVIPLPPKTRSVSKDLLFRDVTGVYPAN